MYNMSSQVFVVSAGRRGGGGSIFVQQLGAALSRNALCMCLATLDKYVCGWFLFVAFLICCSVRCGTELGMLLSLVL